MPRSEEGKFVVPKDQLKRGLCRSSVARLVCRSLLLTHFVRPGRTGYARPAGNTRKPQRPCPRAASGRLPLHRTFGDEEGLRVYREEEAYLASRLSSPCDFNARLMDGAVIRTRRVKTPSRISRLTLIIIVHPSPIALSLRGVRLHLGAEGL
jgi:hypothetical protein